MKRRSIRWQLPLSYAAIALLAALALGLVLLVALTRYYNRLEANYLSNYGMSIDATLSNLPLKDLTTDQLNAQVKSYSLISQSRIQILDPNGNILADSGSPVLDKNNLVFFSLPVKAGPTTASPSSANGRLLTYTVILNQDRVTGTAQSGLAVRVNPDGENMDGTISASPSSALPPALGQSGETSGMVTEPASVAIVSSMKIVEPFSQEINAAGRSNTKMSILLNDASGSRFGTLVLSDGPAYSRQIVSIVAISWLIAAVLAVLVAALTGYFVSRRISRPVTALAVATTRMAQGDLSARAPGASILELGQLSSAFNLMAGHIEETILALRHFATDAAHEMKTPLTALRTNLDLAQGEADPTRLATYLQRAGEQVLHLDRLVGELLDLSRLEAGVHPAVEETFDLAELVQRTSELYATRAEQAGLMFSLELPDHPVTIVGRPTQIELAVSNLLDNGLKFTRPDGWVKASLAQEADQIVFTVSDNGIGIPEEDLPLLFDRFHRAANARSRQGSGLGLAIVNAVAQAHKGRVRAENLPEGGARFTFSLPKN